MHEVNKIKATSSLKEETKTILDLMAQKLHQRQLINKSCDKSSAMTLKNHDAINQSLKKCLVKKDSIFFIFFDISFKPSKATKECRKRKGEKKNERRPFIFKQC